MDAPTIDTASGSVVHELTRKRDAKNTNFYYGCLGRRPPTDSEEPHAKAAEGAKERETRRLYGEKQGQI
jgi:hypothetical protein